MTLQNQVTEVLNSLVPHGFTFTAFDVTKALRVKNADTVPHHEVRALVHADMTGRTYFRETKEVLDGIHAVVYSEDGKKPYDPSLVFNWLVNAPVQPDKNDIAKNYTVFNLELDKKNRLRVPSHLTMVADMVPGDKVFVQVYDNGYVEIGREPWDKAKVYVVDQYGNIRITIGSKAQSNKYSLRYDYMLERIEAVSVK